MSEEELKAEISRLQREMLVLSVDSEKEISRLTAENERLRQELTEYGESIDRLDAERNKLYTQLKAQGEQEPYGYIEPDGNIISPWNNQPYHIPVYLVIGGRK